MAKAQAKPKPDDNVIRVLPRKDLVITMMVRDVKLVSAILDLVDNSVEGAKRLRPGDVWEAGKGLDPKRFSGLHIDIKFDPSKFVIEDNCGGIELNVAKEHAFRFGRVDDGGGITFALGAFGVGMKRAIFKMGQHFKLETCDAHDEYSIDEDLEAWEADDERWDFHYDLEQHSPGAIPEARRYTRLVITKIRPTIQDDFRISNFEETLLARIGAAHMLALAQGIEINVNGKKPEQVELSLNESEEIRSGFRRVDVPVENGDKLEGVLVTGVGGGRADTAQSGWWIFCNERLVLQADKTTVTGWNAGLPRFHTQYAPFRGYAFLKSANSRVLPWNTTKDGIDENSWAYRKLKPALIEASTPVKKFIDDRKKELDEGKSTLKKALDDTKSRPLMAMAFPTQSSFKAPKAPKPKRKDAKVSYRANKEDLDWARGQLADVYGLKELPDNDSVGQLTFRYFLDTERNE